MLEAIEKLLILQERDRQIGNLEAELTSIAPQRQTKARKVETAHARAEAAKTATMEIESARKELELEVETFQESIQRYANQQFQTKKNDEYQALAREIDRAKKKIHQLEDQQLELMEKAEQARKEAAEVANEAKALQGEVDRELGNLDTREEGLKNRLAEITQGREALAGAVEPGLLSRYERLRKTKGERVVVGIDRGNCGGCHMKLQPHLLLTCRGGTEVAACPNCSRILYYERGMEL